ncbi:MAG TPA: hypothetical protein VG650_15725 [Mycobacteriales bacterium]|nr:hypothetical protein [Mycobacteriales bacterium]
MPPSPPPPAPRPPVLEELPTSRTIEQPPEQPTAHHSDQLDELLTAQPGEQPSEHVLRLAGDVRMLRAALEQVVTRLAQSVEDCGLEASARAAAEAELATVRGAAQAEITKTRAEITKAHEEVRRLTAEAERLRQAVVGAHRQAEQWSEQARQTEIKLKTAMEGASAHIAGLTEQAAAHEAAADLLRQTTADQRSELETARAERDAAHQRCAELEAELIRERSRHPRGNIAAVTVPAAPGTAAPKRPSPLITHALRPGRTVSADIHEEHPASLTTPFELDAWQRDALAAWAGAGHRGVVEAVTSEGNAQLGCWAIGRALDANMKVLVLTPNAERAELWHDRLTAALGTRQVGKHSGRGTNRLAAYDVVVAAAQNAAKDRVFEPDLGVLVVADEVQELGTPELSRALDDTYPWRLGLTSAYQRDDDGVATYLDRYFGGVSFSLGYDRALAEQVVASFDLATVSMLLTSPEQGEYDACAAATLAGGGGGAGAAKAAVRAYLKAVARRDEILAGTTARDAALRALATAILDAGQAVVVAPTPQAADYIARVLDERGCTTAAIRTGVNGEQRTRRLGRAEEDRDTWLLAGPRGAAAPADLSGIDLAIMVSPPRNRRQLVERLDRILGGETAGGHVRLVVLYVEASIEDELAAGETAPITEVAAHAKRVQRFTSRDPDDLLDFLATGRRVLTLPPDTTAAPAAQGQLGAVE